jgi:hypothetical protein
MQKYRALAPGRIVTLAALLLLGLGTAITITPGSAATGDTVTQAVQKGVNFLTNDAVTWTKTPGNECAACHRQGAALFALSLSKSSGYTVDPSATNGIGFLAGKIAADQESGGTIDGRWSHGNNGLWQHTKGSYALFGLAAYDRYVSTQFSSSIIRGARYAVSIQQADGRWLDDFHSFPVIWGDVSSTARFLYGIAQAKRRASGDDLPIFEQALARGAQWIRDHRDDTAEIEDNFEIAYALIGLHEAGALDTDPDVVVLRDRLLARSFSGVPEGWGVNPSTHADAFDSGLALYALSSVGVRLRDNSIVQTAVNWLNEKQVNDPGTGGGYWDAGFQSRDIPTTFAIVGLGAFGDLGVGAQLPPGEDPVTEVDPGDPNSQEADKTVLIVNLGAFDKTDTYDIQVYGAPPGWKVTVSPASVTVQPGSTGTVELKIKTPPNLPPGYPVVLTVVTTSRTNPTIQDHLNLTFTTGSSVPGSGHRTQTTLIDPPATINVGSPVHLHAHVVDLDAPGMAKDPGANPGLPLGAIVGPTNGGVAFFVGGIAVGNDNDNDGDGIFEVTWTPPDNWTTLGAQALQAQYSGVASPPGTFDSTGSQDVTTVAIEGEPIVIQSLSPPSLKSGAKNANIEITGTGFVSGATVTMGNGVTINHVTLRQGGGSKGGKGKGKAKGGAGATATTRTLVANVTVANNAAPGFRDVTVTNATGQTTTASNALIIEPDDGPGALKICPTEVRFPTNGTQPPVFKFGNAGPGTISVVLNRPEGEFELGSEAQSYPDTPRGQHVNTTSEGAQVYTLPPGAKMFIHVNRTNHQPGTYTGKLIVQSTDPNRSRVEVPITGTFRSGSSGGSKRK